MARHKTPHRKRLEQNHKTGRKLRDQHVANWDTTTLKPNALANHKRATK